MTNSNSTKHFVELAKAWINDKDIDEGKMWYYYIYVMCDKIRQAEMECYEEEQEIINIVRNQYNTYKQRKESIAKCDEEMAKCQALLDKLGINDKPAKENDEIIALQKEVNELKNIIRKANQMVPPPMKEMLPQDMKNAMDKVGQ